jgi:hypothetical protein
MILSRQFARFTRSILTRCSARPAVAALMALGLGGAVAGGALALSPTVDTALVFRGGVNIVTSLGQGGVVGVYLVPAGRKFMLTDLVISNESDTIIANGQLVYTGVGASCDFLSQNRRTNLLKVPAGATLHIPFVTGIGFSAGQVVCIINGGNSIQTHWTVRGYLFE